MNIKNLRINNLFFTFEAKSEKDFYDCFDTYKEQLNLNKWYRSFNRAFVGQRFGYYCFIIPLRKNITLKDAIDNNLQ